MVARGLEALSAVTMKMISLIMYYALIGFLADLPATWINATGDTVASMIVTRLVEGKEWMGRAQEES